METKLIAMILGVALVLATATIYTQSVFAVPIGSGGAGGNGGTGGVGDVCLSCFVGGSNGGQTAHDISALRAGIAGVIGGGNGGVGSTGPGDSIINNNNLGFSPGFGGWQR